MNTSGFSCVADPVASSTTAGTTVREHTQRVNVLVQVVLGCCRRSTHFLELVHLT